MAGLSIVDPYPRPGRVADIEPLWAGSAHYDELEVWTDWGDTPAPVRSYAVQYASRRQATLAAIMRTSPPPGLVLDIAGGSGNFTATLARLGYRVVWNDLRGELAEYVRRKQPADADVDYVAGNIFEIGGTHVGRYDAVIALEVIEHVAHPDRFVANAAQLLKPGGKLVLSTPNGGYFNNGLPRFSDHPDPSVFETIQFKPNSDGHIFLLYEDEMRRFAHAHGLRVETIDLITSVVTAGYLKLHLLNRVVPPRILAAIENAARRLPRAVKARAMVQMIAVLSKPR